MVTKDVLTTEGNQKQQTRQCKILHIFNKTVEAEEALINSYLAKGYEIKAVASSHGSAYRVYLEKKV